MQLDRKIHVSHNLKKVTSQLQVFIQNGEFNNAEQICQDLISRYPQQAQGFIGLARIAMRTQQWELAQQRWQQACQQFPRNLEAHLGLAQAAWELGEFDNAEQICQDLISRYPQQAQGFIGLARVAMRTQQWELAQQRWQQACQQFPRNLEAHLGLAQAAWELEEFDRAEKILTNLLIQQQYKPKVFQLLSFALRHTNNWNIIFKALDRLIFKNKMLCVTLDDRNILFEILDFLLIRCVECNQLEHAINLIQNLEAHIDRSVTIDCWKSFLYREKGYYQDSELILHKNLQFYSSDRDQEILYLRQAKNAWDDFDLERTILFCREVMKFEGELSQEAGVMIALASIKLDKEKVSKKTLAKLQIRNPLTHYNYTLMFEILFFKDKNTKAALSICNTAIDRGLVNSQIYGYKALALSRLNRKEKALKTIDIFLKRRPNNKLGMMYRVQILRDLGQYQNALNEFNKILKIGEFFPIFSTGDFQEINIQYLQCNPGYKIYDSRKVSVIMTTYKKDELLSVAISSILNQTHQNLELIIVDDCSPDDTLEFLQKISQCDGRVRVFKMKKNEGTYVAKNHGMCQSTGDYITFMDSDDWLHPQTIETQIKSLQSSNILAVTCGFLRVDLQSNIEFKPEPPMGQAHITVCFKKTPVLDTIGFFDAVRTGADTEHLRRIMTVWGPGVVKRIQFPLLVSTRHSGSITGGGTLGFSWFGPGIVDGMYAASSRRWHRQIRNQTASPYLPHPLDSRRFDVPQIMLGEE